MSLKRGTRVRRSTKSLRGHTSRGTGVLDSFLIEITRDILRFNDDDGKPLVTKIADVAGQKGTGKWTAINGELLSIASRCGHA